MSNLIGLVSSLNLLLSEVQLALLFILLHLRELLEDPEDLSVKLLIKEKIGQICPLIFFRQSKIN